MAAAKKIVKRKKMVKRKKTIIVEKEKLQEYEGLKLGDEIWFVRVDGRIRKGEIDCFYLKDKREPAVGLIGCFPESAYYISPVRCCSYDKKNLKDISWNL
jgi:hypothetical protein